VIFRFVTLLGLWIVFDGVKPEGLAIGAMTAALATWASLRLLPRSSKRLRIFPLLSLGGHFLWSSIVAGVDVAWRVFQPRMPLRPGFVTCDCGLPASTTRDLFLSMISLMPGSVPVADEDGRIIMHCLDTEQPVAAQVADNEARLRRALEDGRDA
jgi:multicomponent Na+:H+ antiporter subunit E